MVFSPKQAKAPWSIKDLLSIIYRRSMNKNQLFIVMSMQTFMKIVMYPWIYGNNSLPPIANFEQYEMDTNSPDECLVPQYILHISFPLSFLDLVITSMHLPNKNHSYNVQILNQNNNEEA